MVIRDIRNADVSSHSRVVPITIVMTINLVPVEIASGDVATRAGNSFAGVELFLTQINRRRADKATRACVRAKTQNETDAGWKARHRERRS